MAVDERAVKFHTLGNTLMAEQKYNEAITNYSKAIELAPDYAAAVYHLGEAFEAKMLEDQAFRMYTKAIELNPEYATEHIDAGLDSLLSGPLGKAVAAYKKAAKEEQQSAGAPAAAPAQAAGTQMAQQSAGQYDGPIAQKGLEPRQLIVEEADLMLRSVVNSTDSITARVLGDRDVPVLGCPVEFRILAEDPKLADGALAKNVELLQKAPQPKLVAPTDENGFATVVFRRSKFTGVNKVAVTVKGLPEVIVEDSTLGHKVAEVEITPSDRTLGAGHSTLFCAHLKDKFGNLIVGREMQFTLHEHEEGTWSVADAATAVSDDSGAACCEFRLPTQSGKQCRLQVVNKETQFTARHEFTLVSAAVGSALFIPMQGRAAAGRPFILKLKLLDEFDNPVSGRRAAIALQSAQGGEWLIEDVSAPATGEDGSVHCTVVPPAAAGSEAVFTVEARGIEPGAFQAAFQSVSEDEADITTLSVPSATMPETDGAFPPLPADMPAHGVTSDFMDSLLPRPSDAPSRPLKGPGLDEIDFDQDDSGFATAQPQEPELGEEIHSGESALNALDGMLDDAPRDLAPEPDAYMPPEPASAAGSAFDALGEMLDMEEPAAPDLPPIPGAPHIEEPFDYSGEPGASDQGLVLPDDAGTGDYGYDEPYQDTAVDEPVFGEPGAMPVPDPSPALAPPLPGGVVEIRLEKTHASCRAGETVHISFTAHDASGEALSGGVNAFFSIVQEPDDSDACFLLEQDTPGGKTYKVTSEGSTFLTATLQAPTISGQVIVEAGAGNLRDTITVDVLPGAADRIELSAGETRLAPDMTTTITAMVYDRYDNPLSGESVTFMVEDTKGKGGWLEEPCSAVTDAYGEARATFVSGGNPGDLTIVTATHGTVLAQSVQKVTVETDAVDEEQSYADAGGYEEPPVADQGYEMPPMPAGVEEYAAAPPMPPVAAPAAVAPVAPPLPPLAAPAAPAPYQPGGVEYMHDEFSGPADTGDFTQGVYDGTAQAPVGDDTLVPEEYYEFEDPYAVPKFQVQKGRKPAVEWSELGPKIVKVAGIVLAVALAGWIFTSSWTGINYLINYNKANKLYNQQQLQQALTYYERCTNIKPREAEPYIRMADIYVTFAEKERSPVKAERNLKNAATQLNTAIDEKPDSVEALYSLCHVYKLQGNYGACISFCRQAIQADPKFEAAQSDLNECTEGAGM